MASLGTATIKLGELIAEVEFSQGNEGSTVSLRPSSIRLILKQPYGRPDMVIGNSTFLDDDDATCPDGC